MSGEERARDERVDERDKTTLSGEERARDERVDERDKTTLSGEERARDERVDERDKTTLSGESAELRHRATERKARAVGAEGTAAEEPIHNRIKMLRVDRGVSRRELADALGVHYQTVGYLERGEYSPSLHLALRIAAYFDVPVEFVFSLESFPSLRPS